LAFGPFLGRLGKGLNHCRACDFLCRALRAQNH